MGKLINLNKIRNKANRKKFVMDVILIATIIYVIYAIYLIIRNPSDTVTVESGTLTVEESATGYIIRDETVTKGKNYKNGISQIVGEGEKAAKKQIIYRYYNQNEGEIQEKINAVNKKIQTALEKENVFLNSDIKNLEEQIDGKIVNLNNLNDVKKITEYRSQISDIMIKKATIAGENSKSGTYIKKLIAEREKYEKQLNKGSEYVVAPKSGIVSYRVDGLEEVLNSNGLEELTEQKLNDLDVKTGKIIATSNESAKVVNNFEIYIGAVLNSTAAKQTEIGNSVKITLSNGEEVTAEISYIKEEKNGNKLIIFKLNTLTDELILYRKISFNITWWNVSGIKIPNDSILEEENNERKYVLRKTAKGTEKVYIKILKTNDKYSIIGKYSNEDLKNLKIDSLTYKGIEVHDSIILYPKK